MPIYTWFRWFFGFFCAIIGWCMTLFSFIFTFFCLLIGRRMPEMASPDEIGKMQDVVEVRNYYDSQYFLLFGKMRPVGARFYKRCRNPEKIRAIMEAVRKIKVRSESLQAIDAHLSFRGKSGRILCLGYSGGYGKIVYGSDYTDKSGDLYDAMQIAGFVGQPLPEPPGWREQEETASTKRIQILRKVVEIGRYECDSKNYKNYLEALRSYNVKLVKVCTDPDKIALVMDAVKKLDVSPTSKWKYPKDVSGRICFKSKFGRSFCMIVSFVGGKEIEGLDFIDKTGVFYDSLQNAGLIEPAHRQ